MQIQISVMFNRRDDSVYDGPRATDLFLVHQLPPIPMGLEEEAELLDPDNLDEFLATSAELVVASSILHAWAPRPVVVGDIIAIDVGNVCYGLSMCEKDTSVWHVSTGVVGNRISMN